MTLESFLDLPLVSTSTSSFLILGSVTELLERSVRDGMLFNDDTAFDGFNSSEELVFRLRLTGTEKDDQEDPGMVYNRRMINWKTRGG